MQVIDSNVPGLTIGYWNINGYKSKILGQKIRDKEFLETIGKCDIIGIGEVQSEREIDIDGYVCKKQKIRAKTTKGPKISGGIGVFIKKHLSHLVELVANDNDDSIWILLKPELTKYSQNIYLGTYYVSPYNQKKGQDQFFKTVNEEVYKFMNNGAVLIQGDLNARTASDRDFVEFVEDDPILRGKGESQVNRNSEDKHKNSLRRGTTRYL